MEDRAKGALTDETTHRPLEEPRAVVAGWQIVECKLAGADEGVVDVVTCVIRFVTICERIPANSAHIQIELVIGGGVSICVRVCEGAGQGGGGGGLL